MAHGLSIHYGREWYRGSNPLTLLLSFFLHSFFFPFMEFWILLDYLTHNKASSGKILITEWRHLWFCHVSWELVVITIATEMKLTHGIILSLQLQRIQALIK